MAILKMKKATILARRQDRDRILTLLQQLELLEIQAISAPKDVFRREDGSEKAGAQRKRAQLAGKALEILERWVPEQKDILDGFSGRTPLTTEQYAQREQKNEETFTLCEELIDREKQLAEVMAEIPKKEQQLIALKPWMLYDLPLNHGGTEKTALFPGVLANERSRDELNEQLEEQIPELPFEINIVSSSKEQTCVYVVCRRADMGQVSAALRRIGFARPPASEINPALQCAEITEERDRLKKRQRELEEEIRAYALHREAIRFAADSSVLRAERYEVLGALAQSRRAVLISGFVPAEKAPELCRAVERCGAVMELDDPKEGEEIPIALKNPRFAEPCEGIVEGYSLPTADSFDPSFAVAMFYYILYGIMLSDAAYGLLMAFAAGFLLWKCPGMEKKLKRNIRLFFYCGIATTAAGFLFGSFFGDAIHVIAATFFHRPDVRFGALWMEPINAPMRMLVLCFAIAIIHLFFGLGCKMYLCVKNRDYGAAVFDVGFWYLLVGGLISLLMTKQMVSAMFGIAPWPEALVFPAKFCAALGALGIVLTGGRESKSVGGRIGSGLYSLYGVSNYLSDILSYSRLMALGLATGVIAQVFNKMGTMLGGNLVGAVVFVLVFLIGHTMNLLINALGAYVHTNRLTYVEFFGKFYEGGGQGFKPFAVNTKYFKFKEEI